MFFSLSVNAVAPTELSDSIHYKVTGVNEAVRLIAQSIEGGGWSGEIKSLSRIPPVLQPSMEHLAGLVRGDEFCRTNALIIGGSRGLGELTAKMIAAGGGNVAITYAVGRMDALEVQRQIRFWGGVCQILHYDATLPAKDQLSQLVPSPTSVYYFATPPIFLRKTRPYTSGLFEQFCRVYVDGFYDACISALHDGVQRMSVFYPSSLAVESRPADMTEYAMAKAAGEILCTDLTRFNERLRIVVERLPRMLTDQTATVMPIQTAAPFEVMLPMVRRMEAMSNSSI